jgi:hypothetical protein
MFIFVEGIASVINKSCINCLKWKLKYCLVYDHRRGFRLDIGFFDHINTQLVITLNYSAIANLHTSQFTTAHVNSFTVGSVFSSSCLLTASNNGCSSASVFISTLNGGSLQTAYSWVCILFYYRRSAGQSVWEYSTHLGLTTRILLLSDSCGFVDMRRCLWREDESVGYSCCWPSPAQSFSGPSPMGLATIFYCLRFETSLFVASYDSQGYDGRIQLRLHTGVNLLITPVHEPSRKHCFQQYLYCCMPIRYRGKVFTEPLPRNGSTRYNIFMNVIISY